MGKGYFSFTVGIDNADTPRFTAPKGHSLALLLVGCWSWSWSSHESDLYRYLSTASTRNTSTKRSAKTSIMASIESLY